MSQPMKSRNSINPIRPEHREEISALSRAIKRDPDSPTRPMLVGTDGEQVVLPAEIYEVLSIVVREMTSGHAVTITPLSQRISTQEAADLLGLSRPTLVKLLETGEIAYEKPGRHRRVLLTDILDYRERKHSDAIATLDSMTAAASEAGLYESASDDYAEALRRVRSKNAASHEN